MKDLFASKKFLTAVLGMIVTVGGWALGIPEEVIEKAVYPFLAAIFGFAAQDYAKERDKPKA